MQQGLYSLLTSTSAITDLIGARVTPVVIPPNVTFPCLSFTDISMVADPLLQGPGTSTKRIRFDCWGKSYNDAKNLQAALHSLFDGYVGTLPDGTVIQETQLGNELDLYESDNRIYRSMTEYLFYYIA
jgi:hypothetical protein